MAKVSNLLMSLVGVAGAAAFLAALFFSGVLSSLTSLPLVLMIAVGAAGLSSLVLGLMPIGAMISGGGPKQPKAKKEKKPKKKKEKKSKKDKAAPVDEADDDGDFADDDFDDDFSDSYDSTAGESMVDDDIADFGDGMETSESNVADMLDAPTLDGANDDPFDVSDSFESDVTNVELSMNDSESFDDQFEFGPDSEDDFDPDEKNA